LKIVYENIRGEAQCGITSVGSAYRKCPRQYTVAESEQGKDNFLSSDIAGWLIRSRYVALLMATAYGYCRLASHTEE
jgi:hypothetical protein